MRTRETLGEHVFVCRRHDGEEKIMAAELLSQKKREGFGFHLIIPNPQSGYIETFNLSSLLIFCHFR